MDWRRHFSELKVVTPRVSLVAADDPLLRALGNVAASDVDPMFPSPFRAKWDHFSAENRQKFITRRQEDAWESFSIANWRLPLTVCIDGRVAGEVLVSGQRFREDRVFGTASWLGKSWRGQGLGLEVRVAALQFGFGVLSGERALSGTFCENIVSLEITRRLKYSLSGASLYVGAENAGRRILHYRFWVKKNVVAATRRTTSIVVARILGVKPVIVSVKLA